MRSCAKVLLQPKKIGAGEMISFEIMEKSRKEEILPELFELLFDNMSVIAPTGNDYETDFNEWYSAVSPAIDKDPRNIILIRDKGDIIGYFQYYVNRSVFMMEEIQFKRKYWGSGLFRALYEFITNEINPTAEFVEAYANIANKKSREILMHLGLEPVGTNANGNSIHYRGDCRELMNKYRL